MIQGMGFDLLNEPLDKWTNLNGTDMLGLVFKDPKRWAMAHVSTQKHYGLCES